MKISKDWLSKYIDLSGVSDAELADKLTMAGIEVEAAHKGAEIPAGVVVGEILERKPHPNADKLSVCLVDSGAEKLQIVCGAPNCDAGNKVPLAQTGTSLTDRGTGKDFSIKKAKLRGVESFGMLCSARELGLGDDHGGLMILEKSLPNGRPLSEIVSSNTVFDLEITPNRPDWLSHWGVARDLAALIGKEAVFPALSLPESGNSDAGFPVSIADFSLCPRYTARVVRGVKVAESPAWLKKALESVGLRPINNIVDITNFVLMETGHPLHAFDLSKLEDQKIIVRRAAPGEKIHALDGKIYELKPENLVISDGKKPVALAGIMGGEHTGVTAETVDILLESAVFQTTNIRSSSRNLGVSSDSSYRFERGVDFVGAVRASDRAVSLILELAGGKLTSPLIDVKAADFQPRKFNCRFDRVRSIAGLDISSEKIAEILKALGFGVEDFSAASCVVVVPSYRGDVSMEADIAEETARIYGLDKVPVGPVKSSFSGSFGDAHRDLGSLREGLVSVGLNECVSYSFMDEKTALLDGRFQPSNLLRMSNPLSADFAVMRPSLFGQMLLNVERNAARKNYNLALFETGKVFCADKSLFPEERLECCIALTGGRHPERFSAERAEVIDFYDLKGLLEALFELRKVSGVLFAEAESPNFKAGACVKITAAGKDIGLAGEVAESRVKGMRLQTPLFAALLDADALIGITAPVTVCKPVSLFPPVARDIAFLAGEGLTHQAVLDFIYGQKLKYLESAELFDIFKNDSVGAGKKSMAYSLTYRDSVKTLTDEEVNAVHEKLRLKLAEGLGVELR